MEGGPWLSVGFVVGTVCGVWAGYCDLLSLGPLQVGGSWRMLSG